MAQDFVDLLARRFQRFAKTKCLGSSPLYYHLSQRIAGDRELLSLASHCRADQPTPTLFLGAVHFLLLNGIRDPSLLVFDARLLPDFLSGAASFIGAGGSWNQRRAEPAMGPLWIPLRLKYPTGEHSIENPDRVPLARR